MRTALPPALPKTLAVPLAAIHCLSCTLSAPAATARRTFDAATPSSPSSRRQTPPRSLCPQSSSCRRARSSSRCRARWAAASPARPSGWWVRGRWGLITPSPWALLSMAAGRRMQDGVCFPASLLPKKLQLDCSGLASLHCMNPCTYTTRQHTHHTHLVLHQAVLVHNAVDVAARDAVAHLLGCGWSCMQK